MAAEVQGKKSERTRARIRAAALELFRSKGYEKTTLREIAVKAGCSLGLTYRYFGSKAELVLDLYEELTTRFVQEVSDLPEGTVAARFSVAVHYKLKGLEPYREALGSAALMTSATQPENPVAVLGAGTNALRTRVRRALADLVRGARDVPEGIDPVALGELLHALLLLILLYWFNDPTPEGEATHGLVRFVESTLERMPLLALIPGVGEEVERVAAILRPVFGDRSRLAAPTQI